MMPYRLPCLLIVFVYYFLATNHKVTAKVQYCPETERKALQDFKHNISFNSDSMLSTWDDRDNCCNWCGVSCNHVTGNVVDLDFDSWELEPTKLLNGNNLLPLLSLNYLVSLHLNSADFGGNQIPKLIGSFKHLKKLSLSYFTGKVPSEIGNLSTLQQLMLIYNFDLFIDSSAWLSQLKALRYLDLTSVNMSRASGWLQSLSTLTNISELHLSDCGLTSLAQLSFVNFTSLTTIDLSYNSISSSLPDWLGQHKDLILLDVSHNLLNGSLPAAIGNLSLLQHLDLSDNMLNGQVPKSLWQLKNLLFLDVSQNSFNGSLPAAIGNLSLLQHLDLSNNMLNGQIPKSIAKLERLEELNIGSNYFKSILMEAYFSNMSKLTSLNLSYNSFVFETSDNWIPSFQLVYLCLDFCQVGPQFPNWFKTQNSLCFLSASNAGIKAHSPNWLGNLTRCGINLSNNNISGTLSQFINSHITFLDLSNNSLSGTIPTDLGKIMQSLYYIDISNNNLSGSIPSSFCDIVQLEFLSFSSNKLSGVLPHCWGTNSNALESIRLSDNYIHGKLPVSLCNLSLITLQLSNNILSGTLPACLTSNSILFSLNLGYNNFSGDIPSWNGSATSLIILSLRSNAFTGRIPNLSSFYYLQILDLSNNHLSGYIPPSLGDLTSMTTLQYENFLFGPDFFSQNDSTEIVVVVTKGKEHQYNIKLLPLVKLIDLSNNGLAGDIPDELMKLNGLQTLNLSGNNLIGKIPTNIGNLQHLETLDLARNNLSGAIPSSITTLHFLSNLNLSNNNLSGKIPTGDQLQALDDSSIYQNNPYLCGSPLKGLCQEEVQQHSSSDKHDEELISLYMAIAPGFVLGFWIVWGTLILHKKWRNSYFLAIDKVYFKFL